MNCFNNSFNSVASGAGGLSALIAQTRPMADAATNLSFTTASYSEYPFPERQKAQVSGSIAQLIDLLSAWSFFAALNAPSYAT